MKKHCDPTHEEAFAMAFVCPPKRQRVRELLQSEKGRKKFLSQLPHFSDLDPRFSRIIEPSKQYAELVVKLLREKGAGADCYVISSLAEIDQINGPLDHILLEIVGCYPGTIVSCIPGRLAYYEGEAINERYILER
jgi:hypothetical protein